MRDARSDSSRTPSAAGCRPSPPPLLSERHRGCPAPLNHARWLEASPSERDDGPPLNRPNPTRSPTGPSSRAAAGPCPAPRAPAPLRPAAAHRPDRRGGDLGHESAGSAVPGPAATRRKAVATLAASQPNQQSLLRQQPHNTAAAWAASQPNQQSLARQQPTTRAAALAAGQPNQQSLLRQQPTTRLRP